MYDLPNKSLTDKKIYHIFIKNLKAMGFIKLQNSVYTKCIFNYSSYIRNLNKIKKISPRTGNISLLKISEKQYQKMEYISGNISKQEEKIGNKTFIIFD